MSKFSTRPTFVNASKISGFTLDGEGNTVVDGEGNVTAHTSEPNTAETKQFVVAEASKIGDYIVYDDEGNFVEVVPSVDFDETYLPA